MDVVVATVVVLLTAAAPPAPAATLDEAGHDADCGRPLAQMTWA